MKKFFKENLVIIIIVLVFLLLIGGFVFLFINNMVKSQGDIEERVKQVDSTYQVFTEDTSRVSEVRTKIYSEIFNNAYYVDFSSKDESWKKTFSEYYGLIDDLHNNHVDIIEVCNSYNFIYDSTKQKCQSMLESYEILINNFVTDYKLYNDNIVKYNEWTNSNTNYSKIEEYSPKGYLEYFDYNGNKKLEHY